MENITKFNLVNWAEFVKNGYDQDNRYVLLFTDKTKIKITPAQMKNMSAYQLLLSLLWKFNSKNRSLKKINSKIFDLLTENSINLNTVSI